MVGPHKQQLWYFFVVTPNLLQDLSIFNFLSPKSTEPEIYVIDLNALAAIDSKPPTPKEPKRPPSRSVSVRPIEPKNGKF